jgi:hypothetical protein
MSANKIGLSSTIGIPIQCQSHLLQKRKRAVKAIPAFSLIRSKERERIAGVIQGMPVPLYLKDWVISVR